MSTINISITVNNSAVTSDNNPEPLTKDEIDKARADLQEMVRDPFFHYWRNDIRATGV